MSRFVAADASPLIGLATVQALHWLRELYGTVTITRAVRDEVMAGGKLPGAEALDAAMREGWVRVAATPMDTWRYDDLGAGEASTIALALERGGEVLMDDALGRTRAESLGLTVTGTADLVAAAKRAGLVDSIRPLFDRLARRGFILPADAVRDALAAAGES